jgi:[glutamine synthetase] adenylyltransferase / [glutamine synthetase]-adenylyl-L-tyrosine phosphorylase
VRDLPDPAGARRFYEQLAAEHPRIVERLARDEGLRADVLALAAWSPLLATTLAQSPEYIAWLARERTDTHVRTVEELHESLARFALTHTQLAPHVLFARFRRRELLRIYLHDIRRVSTVVETTEELSNLADAVLTYALDLARQELDNKYGPPLAVDPRGRTTTARFVIVALGKLGSRELNYASDIDLLFLHSDDGHTSGAGTHGQTTNREYFNRLAERIARLTGQQTGEGAAYRVDLRLRPHGRDGALSVSLAEALRYYCETAQAWELQALIRARASAGSAQLFARFAEGVRPRVYTHAGTVAQALANVRLAKQKIDRQHAQEAHGFNVKLGRGGIREIEFIAQALQLAHGRDDQWLQHAPHTLVSLGRLADRALITARERTELSDAYTFLRTLEHRLQMEHGLQTHTVPDDTSRRTMLARRLNFTGPDEAARAAFNDALAQHTTHVRTAYDRVFGQTAAPTSDANTSASTNADADQIESLSAAHNALGARAAHVEVVGERATEHAFVRLTAQVFAGHLMIDTETEPASATKERRTARVVSLLHAAADASLNPHRALTLVARVAASLDKTGAQVDLTEANLRTLVRLCGASELFGEMLASNPALITVLVDETKPSGNERDYRALLRAQIDREKSYAAELTALRRMWARLLLEIGARDAAGALTLAESNRLQTELATASINAALLIARRELARRFGRLDAGPRLVVLGLGRLGSGGMDYGSDLDLVLVYDNDTASPIHALTRDEAYARLGELLTAALSSITRAGHLYRVDLRLRPDGQKGPLVRSAASFIEYLHARADVWEWLAYVKLRAVGGDLELGRAVERAARRAIHEAARRCARELLRTETRRIRERLEHERATHAARGLDIKFGAGGMLDVYFAARYLQLRDDVPDEGADRSTPATLARLRAAGSLTDEEHRTLADGYACLRALDHNLRLIAGRSTRLPNASDHPLLANLARATRHSSVAQLLAVVNQHRQAIRAAYERITSE